MYKEANILIVIFVLLIGCRSRSTHEILYTPNQDIQISDAKSIIKKVLQQQPPRYNIVKVEVFDDYFSITKSLVKKSFWTEGMTTVPQVTNIYYENIGNVKIYERSSRNSSTFYLQLSDITERRILNVFSSQRKNIEDFVDSIYRLKRI